MRLLIKNHKVDNLCQITKMSDCPLKINFYLSNEEWRNYEEKI
jgi:hypothetical protein